MPGQIENAYTSGRADREIRAAKLWAATTPGHTVATTNGYGSCDPKVVSGTFDQARQGSEFEHGVSVGQDAQFPIPGFQGRFSGRVTAQRWTGSGARELLVDLNGDSFGHRPDAQLAKQYWVAASDVTPVVR